MANENGHRHSSPKELKNMLMHALISAVFDEQENSPLGQFFGLSSLPEKELQELRALLKSSDDESKARFIKSANLILSIRINRKNINAVCSHLAMDINKNTLIDNLIKHGATQPMMFEYFGFDAVETSRLRKNLKVSSSGGRPKAIDDNQLETVYNYYEIYYRRYLSGPEQHGEANLCLKIHKKAKNITMHQIYTFICEMRHL